MEIVLLQAASGGGGAFTAQMLMFGAILAIMYFFMIRPQAKKARAQQAFIDNLKKGDKVVTAGGIYGKIAKLEKNAVILQVDSNTKIKIDKAYISSDASAAKPSQETKEIAAGGNQ